MFLASDIFLHQNRKQIHGPTTTSRITGVDMFQHAMFDDTDLTCTKFMASTSAFSSSYWVSDTWWRAAGDLGSVLSPGDDPTLGMRRWPTWRSHVAQFGHPVVIFAWELENKGKTQLYKKPSGSELDIIQRNTQNYPNSLHILNCVPSPSPKMCQPRDTSSHNSRKKWSAICWALLSHHMNPILPG
jgi:hypothetical protein